MEDKVIDYMIGLEALYLPGSDNANVSLRLQTRVASSLFLDPLKRSETTKFIKNMYDVRSIVMHGNDEKRKQRTLRTYLNSDNVEKLENLLRSSIMKWINNSSDFSKEKFEEHHER
jgi:hypothetical protein